MHLGADFQWPIETTLELRSENPGSVASPVFESRSAYIPSGDAHEALPFRIEWQRIRSLMNKPREGVVENLYDPNVSQNTDCNQLIAAHRRERDVNMPFPVRKDFGLRKRVFAQVA